VALDPDTLYVTHEAFRRWETGRFQAAGQLNEYWTNILQRDPDMRRVVLCVEVVIGKDTIVRLSNRPCSTSSGTTGREYFYNPVIEETPPLSQSYTLGGGTATVRNISLQIPNEMIDVATLIGQGRMLAGVGEVSFQVDGGDYDQRMVIMRGDMADGVSFGALTELVDFGLMDPNETTDVSLPPFIIDNESFSAPADNAYGQRYAVIFPSYDNVPGWWITTTSTPRALVCWGHLTGSSGVYVDGTLYSSTDVAYGHSYVQDSDNLGNPYTCIEFTGSASWEFSEQVYASGLSGGSSTTHPIDQIKQVVQRFTAMGSIGTSTLLFADAVAKLPEAKSYMIVNAGGSGNTTAMAFIESTFLRSFPMVSMLWHPTGYGPIVTDRRADVVVRNFVSGQWPILDRASMLTETPKGDCYNEFTLQYGYDAITDSFGGIATRGSTSSNLCALSLEQLGHRPMDVVESLYIHDAQTAEYVVDWMVDHYTFPAYLVDYAMSASMFVTLKCGDNVRITDSEFGWEDVSATVEAMQWNGNHAIVTLRVWWRYFNLGTGSSNAGGGGGGGQT
jgi:hypothetical protein